MTESSNFLPPGLIYIFHQKIANKVVKASWCIDYTIPNLNNISQSSHPVMRMPLEKYQYFSSNFQPPFCFIQFSRQCEQTRFFAEFTSYWIRYSLPTLCADEWTTERPSTTSFCGWRQTGNRCMYHRIWKWMVRCTETLYSTRQMWFYLKWAINAHTK